VKGPETLKSEAFGRIAIANPTAAPYGVAGIETLKALGVHDSLKGKIVLGASIAQTLQFVETGNAELGFVALAQLVGRAGGSRWEPPQAMYSPIRQDAVLLSAGRDDEAAKAFIGYLRGPEARKVIAAFGYAVD
jgi:molybdate transport system substrate-binding protein